MAFVHLHEVRLMKSTAFNQGLKNNFESEEF